MREEELNKLAQYIYEYMYDETLKIEIKINNRLKRTLAWFVFDDKVKPPKPKRIEVSKVICNQELPIIIDILMHELVHYHLCKIEKPFDDRDEEFKNELAKRGIFETNRTVQCGKKLKYIYNKYKLKCNCGYYLNTYARNLSYYDFPFILCPKCQKELEPEYIKQEELDYKPTYLVKNIIECYNRKR